VWYENHIVNSGPGGSRFQRGARSPSIRLITQLIELKLEEKDNTTGGSLSFANRD